MRAHRLYEHEGRSEHVLYKQRFRSEMVKRLLAPKAPSQGALARETGIPQPTLSRWVREATLDEVPKKSATHGGKRKGAGRSKATQPKRRVLRERSAEEKLQIVLEAAKFTDAELGNFLRERGVFEAIHSRHRREGPPPADMLNEALR